MEVRPDTAALLAEFERLAREAGAAILGFYGDAAARRADKADASPLTEADLAADRIVWDGLKKAFPQIAIVTEERAETHAAGIAPDRFFLVDPLDGTKEFLSGNGQFTVNIALIENGAAVAGVVFAPALDRLFLGASGHGAHEMSKDGLRAMAVRPAPERRVAVASRSHRSPETDAFLDAQGISDCVSAGSSLKFCLVAGGEADIYPRFGTTMEWDTAAGQAVLEAAGGAVLTAEGAPFLYGKPAFRNGDFIALGDKNQAIA
jgi:3'(2'), 5'-bisphosphate nucleotidase